jgi:nucleotide-binding universal stress UspA family protein
MAEPRQDDRERVVFRRILVALDTSRESLAALDTAAHMAKRLQAELAGLFVEDVNLFKLAQHSFVREVNLATRVGRSLDLETLERELKTQAAMARRALEQAAGQLQVPWSFRVTRGVVETELVAAALEADLIALGKAIRPLTGAARLGRAARALSLQSSRSLLFAVTGLPASEAVALAYDGSAIAGDALELAARIADNDGGRLLVFLIAGSDDVAAEHEAAVRRRLRGSRLTLAFRRVLETSCSVLLPAIEAERPRLLVVGVDPRSAAGNALAPIVECVGCPVLLVRDAGKAV